MPFTYAYNHDLSMPYDRLFYQSFATGIQVELDTSAFLQKLRQYFLGSVNSPSRRLRSLLFNVPQPLAEPLPSTRSLFSPRGGRLSAKSNKLFLVPSAPFWYNHATPLCSFDAATPRASGLAQLQEEIYRDAFTKRNALERSSTGYVLRIQLACMHSLPPSLEGPICLTAAFLHANDSSSFPCSLPSKQFAMPSSVLHRGDYGLFPECTDTFLKIKKRALAVLVIWSERVARSEWCTVDWWGRSWPFAASWEFRHWARVRRDTSSAIARLYEGGTTTAASESSVTSRSWGIVVDPFHDFTHSAWTEIDDEVALLWFAERRRKRMEKRLKLERELDDGEKGGTARTAPEDYDEIGEKSSVIGGESSKRQGHSRLPALHRWFLGTETDR
ncbi:uncharacterized protein EV420DRAFT_1479538 [Desarmillaria tabescens]|uniref:Uncharacterized protein n=1 Tax=Armillaria tabescens TaxID=1929756 RepID=A0AA39KCX7_ARMTA|nr:uncharacterized protein EV420DRAFT_1479538 [Desarmillaria tabescens]KAK0458871.1 hypothetical protein EV420DRAFT_1479538 [Desarmillaria tabescens]